MGSGEPLLRLEKSLPCTATGLGLALDLDIRKDAQALGIPFAQTQAVLADGRVMLTGPPRTEEIEAGLRQHANGESRDRASSKPHNMIDYPPRRV